MLVRLKGKRGEQTETSGLDGLFSGGVLFRPVAQEGTSTSPGISPPSPLDFLRRRAPSAPFRLLREVVLVSGGKGSDMLKGTMFKRVQTQER
jgi:hypothetical protein